VERIGWRAIIASMGALSLAAALMVAFDLRGQAGDSDSDANSNDRTVVQMESLPIS
jgi:predicted MFS family arabinose efflux permease